MRVSRLRILEILLLLTAVAVAERGALFLEASTPEATVKLGNRIIVHVRITNRSNSVVAFNDQRRDCDYKVAISSSSGIAVSETTFAKSLNCTGEFHITGRNIQISLKPGECHEEDIELTHLYEINAPGDYSVQISRTFSQIGTFTSNLVNFTLIRR